MCFFSFFVCFLLSLYISCSDTHWKYSLYSFYSQTFASIHMKIGLDTPSGLPEILSRREAQKMATSQWVEENVLTELEPIEREWNQRQTNLEVNTESVTLYFVIYVHFTLRACADEYMYTCFMRESYITNTSILLLLLQLLNQYVSQYMSINRISSPSSVKLGPMLITRTQSESNASSTREERSCR